MVGGYAVLLHGFPRFTQHVDLFVRMESGNVTRLRQALDSVFADESLQEITAGELAQYPVIRYASPDGFLLDIIGRLGEMVQYGDVAWEHVEIEGVPVRVATAESLLRMKADTVRPQDRQDAEFLRALLKKSGG